MRGTCPAIIRCLSICRENGAWWSAAGKLPHAKSKGCWTPKHWSLSSARTLADLTTWRRGDYLPGSPLSQRRCLGQVLVIGATNARGQGGVQRGTGARRLGEHRRYAQSPVISSPHNAGAAHSNRYLDRGATNVGQTPSHATRRGLRTEYGRLLEKLGRSASASGA